MSCFNKSEGIFSGKKGGRRLVKVKVDFQTLKQKKFEQNQPVDFPSKQV